MSGARHIRKLRIPSELTVRTLTEVADELNITPQAVQQIEVKALKKLRRAALKLKINEFLD